MHSLSKQVSSGQCKPITAQSLRSYIINRRIRKDENRVRQKCHTPFFHPPESVLPPNRGGRLSVSSWAWLGSLQTSGNLFALSIHRNRRPFRKKVQPFSFSNILQPNPFAECSVTTSVFFKVRNLFAFLGVVGTSANRGNFPLISFVFPFRSVGKTYQNRKPMQKQKQPQTLLFLLKLHGQKWG